VRRRCFCDSIRFGGNVMGFGYSYLVFVCHDEPLLDIWTLVADALPIESIK
jgi:hypothetical protein